MLAPLIQLLADLNLKKTPQLLELQIQYEDVEELITLSPEKILLKWMNFHLKKAGYTKTVTNFSADIKVSTYALLVEDVLEVVSDTVVVHEAATSRIQRLTKGFWGGQRVGYLMEDLDDYSDFEGQSEYRKDKRRRSSDAIVVDVGKKSTKRKSVELVMSKEEGDALIEVVRGNLMACSTEQSSLTLIQMGIVGSMPRQFLEVNPAVR
ncbi:unnamed protein product [Lactuca virosa]|uniref:Calponin-homology (CH) domain-containing protein n=1 Tax=Lactuca virosa TaxID=75947 RepID=A0AAU9LPT8_9ASTR|nr:unnamed protein product [Lactuca virosa]